jgi:hypothetical protein
MAACDTMQTNLSHSVYFMCAVVAAAMVTTPNFAFALSKSSDHNLTVLNNTGDLKDCHTTSQIGPCWDSHYQTFVPWQLCFGFPLDHKS